MKNGEMRIMVAEDDADDQLLIQHALEANSWGGDVQFVADGEDLMVRLSEAKRQNALPGLIFLDLNMPRKDGRQALEEIKSDEQLKQIPVLILTTSDAPDDIRFSYRMGSNTYFTKPSKYSDLVEIIKTIKVYWAEKATALN